MSTKSYPALQLRLIKGYNMLIYKVIEIATVTDDVIEETLNSWSSKGWQFDGLQFAMRESSKRPAMAFALFTQDDQRPVA